MGFFAVLVTNYTPFLPLVRYWITSNLRSTNYSRVTRQRLRASCQVPNDHINSDRMLDLLLGLFCSRKFHFALGFPPFFDGTSHSAPLAIEVSSNTAHRQRVYDPHPGEVFFCFRSAVVPRDMLTRFDAIKFSTSSRLLFLPHSSDHLRPMFTAGRCLMMYWEEKYIGND